MTYAQLINLSMNQTLARSINTSAVAIIPVLAVLLVGAELLGASTLQEYGLALFVGLLSGAYSSIFIASPILCHAQGTRAALGRHREAAGARGATGPARSPPPTPPRLSTQTEHRRRRAAPQRRPGQADRAASGPGPSGRARAPGTARPPGTGTAVMDRPRPAGVAARQAPRPRKGKGKRKR